MVVRGVGRKLKRRTAVARAAAALARERNGRRAEGLAQRVQAFDRIALDVASAARRVRRARSVARGLRAARAAARLSRENTSQTLHRRRGEGSPDESRDRARARHGARGQLAMAHRVVPARGSERASAPVRRPWNRCPFKLSARAAEPRARRANGFGRHAVRIHGAPWRARSRAPGTRRGGSARRGGEALAARETMAVGRAARRGRHVGGAVGGRPEREGRAGDGSRASRGGARGVAPSPSQAGHGGRRALFVVRGQVLARRGRRKWVQSLIGVNQSQERRRGIDGSLTARRRDLGEGISSVLSARTARARAIDHTHERLHECRFRPYIHGES